MAIDFGDGNTAKYISIADSADLTIPDDDWCVGVWTRLDDNSGSQFQFLLSNGNVNISNTVNLYLIEASYTTSSLRNRWRIFAGTTFITSSSAPGGDGKNRLIIAQRRGSDLELYFCEPGQTPSLEANTSFSAGPLDGGNWVFGAAENLNNSRFYEEHAGELFYLDQSLSSSQIKALGAGAVITSLVPTDNIVLYNPFAEPDSQPVIGDFTHTKGGSPVQSEHFPVSQPVGANWAVVTPDGAGDTNIAGSTEALTITTNAAAIGYDVNVTSATEALTVTEHQATISLDAGVSANAEALSLTVFSASIGFDAEVLANTEALTLTTNSASIGYSTGIVANAEDLTITSFQASISFDVDVGANTEALTITEHSATIGYDTGIVANTEAITLATYSASVALDVDVPANIEGLSLATNPASIGYSTGIVANAESLTVSVFQASITFDVNVLANAEALTITPHAASISVGGDVDVPANVEALSVTTYAASIVTAEAFTFPIVDNFSGLWVTDPKDKIQFTTLDGTDKASWSFVNEQIQHANPIQLDRFGNIPSIYIESGDCVMNLMNEFGVIKYSITKASNSWYVGGVTSILPVSKSLNLTTHRARIQNHVNPYSEAMSLITYAANVSV